MSFPPRDSLNAIQESGDGQEAEPGKALQWLAPEVESPGRP